MTTTRRLLSGCMAIGLCFAPLIGARGVTRPTRPSPSPASESEGIARAQRYIAEREYEIGRNDLGLQAPNRAHDLRTYFEPTGVRVVDREDGARELVALRTERFGRGECLAPVAPGEVTSAGRRVESRRAGFVEWYENGEKGLEHGYEVSERPGGKGPLRVEVAFEGVRARVFDGRVELETSTGRRLEYGKLKVWDASGRELRSRLEVGSSGAAGVAIVVEDAGATYPLTIDPLLTSTADATLQSDQAGAFLGYSVSGAGDVNGDGYADVIVGAPFYDDGETDEGGAFVFLGSASGISAMAPAIIESNQADAFLGWSVAGARDVNGDGYSDVIVGAYRYSDGEVDEGAAFVYLGSASGIASGSPTTAAATLQVNQVAAQLGWSVSGAGDVNGDGYSDVIVGSPSYDNGETNEGGAFVYLGSASGISETADATLQSDQVGAFLGWSVSGAGDVNGDGYTDVVVGAPLYVDGEAFEGAAFVYLGSASGISEAADATLQVNQGNANLGKSVSGAGDVNGDGYSDVIVGADQYADGEAFEGAAFVFLGSASGIFATAAAIIQANQGSAQLGNSVAGAGDVNGDGYADLLVGAFGYTDGEANEGAAFVYLGSASGIASGSPATADATLQANQVAAEVGQSVAGTGDVNGDGYADLIVGARSYSAGEANEGGAFVFLGAARGIASGNPTTANGTLKANQEAIVLGWSVAGAGDVNGDGYSDVIVGAPSYEDGETQEGAAFVYLGSSSGISETVDAILQSDQEGAFLGWSVSGAGDVNGDGYSDVIVGAPGYADGETQEGAAFVYLGSASGIASGTPATAAATLQADLAGVFLGYSVAGAGDVNGDGYADVVVGAPQYSAGESGEGGAFVYLGSASGISETADATLQSNQGGAQLGISVAGAGDVNGDGYADVVVGAPFYSAGESGEGGAFVYLGSASGISETADATIQSNQAGASLGYSVAGAGDVNGDGYADVIVGAYLYDDDDEDEGGAFVYLGSASGISETADVTLQSDQEFANLGFSVAGAGDVNGDGYSDVIVGAYQYDDDEANEGAAFAYLGSASGISETADATLQSDQAGAELGRSVAGAGDVNGDGYADVIVGADRYDAGEMDQGAAFAHNGNGGGNGKDVRAIQLRGNSDTTPVQAWGGSYDPDDFQVRTNATDPSGRGNVKLEVQVCPVGFNWDDPECIGVSSSTWTDVTATAAGVPLTLTVPGLTANTQYRWRARVLRSPHSVTQLGITPAAKPEHSPWRRLSAQSVEADIRTVEVACVPPSAPTISGETSVIAGDADLDADMLVGYTYSVEEQPGATYTWSVTPEGGATIWDGQDTNEIQVVYDNSAGPFTVSVTVGNECGSEEDELAVTKLHNGFSWDFLGTGTPAGWTNEIGTWAQSLGAYENPAHSIVPAVLYESASYGQVYGDFTVEAAIVVSRTTAQSQAASNTLWIRGIPTPLNTGTASRWYAGYAFNIANTGKYSIFRYDPGGNVALQTWVAPAPTIYTDGVTANVLKVEATGSTLTFSINGTVVKTLTGQTPYPTGKVGVAMVRTSAAIGDVLKVNYMKLAPSPFSLPKRAVQRESAEQEAANERANRRHTRTNPLFDGVRE